MARKIRSHNLTLFVIFNLADLIRFERMDGNTVFTDTKIIHKDLTANSTWSQAGIINVYNPVLNSITITDDLPPNAPQNLSVTESSVGEHPSLSWTANTEADLKEYNIYREDTYYMGVWHKIGTETSSPHIDTGVSTSHHHGDDIYYKITAIDNGNNESNYSNEEWIEARIEKIINGEENIATIKEYALNSNYPNPFNPTTQISYQIPENGFINLIVYNALGQQVAELVNQHQSIGKYSVKFNASNLPSGVYIYRLHAGEFSSTEKMILTK